MVLNELTDFNGIYKSFYKRSFRFVKGYVFEDMIAEDIASESLISLWQTMKKEEVSHPLSLLLTILKNNSLNYLKSEERNIAMKESLSSLTIKDLNYKINSLEACDPQEMFSSEISEIIEQTLASLSEQTRTVFEMSRYEQRSVKEIAEIMNLTPKAVEYHITKSLKRLRVTLKDYLPLLYWLLG